MIVYTVNTTALSKNYDLNSFYSARFTKEPIIYKNIICEGVDFSIEVNRLLSLCEYNKTSPYLGEGAFRRVYSLTDSLVLKVSKRSIDSNVREALVSSLIYNSSITENIKKHFLKVYYISEDAQFLIAEKCIYGGKWKDTKDPNRVANDITIKLKACGFGNLTDVRWANVMWRGTTAVLSDMGNFSIESISKGLKKIE